MANENRNDDSDDGSTVPSPAPSDSNSAQRPGASKDRRCPFCDQLFTSSSLGRHLDTFIRERNPKPADGVHNVTEIRKIRASITRRHARVSSAKEQAQKKAPHSPAPIQRPLPDANHVVRDSTLPQPVQPRIMQSHPEPEQHMRNFIPTQSQKAAANRAHWTATGVINDLPPRPSGTPMGRELPYPRTSISSFRDAEDQRNLQATQMALKEVLNALTEATKQTKTEPLFDFDFLSLNFPALCLRLLNRPTSLAFDAAREPKSWLDIPFRTELEDLVDILNERVRDHTAGERSALMPLHDAYVRHAQRAFDAWSGLPESQRADIWQLELKRAYANASSRAAEASTSADSLRDENTQLRSQLAAAHTSSLPYLSQSVIKGLVEKNDLTHWNFEDLISKWKSALAHRPSHFSGAPTAFGTANHATPGQSSEDTAAATPSSTHSYGHTQRDENSSDFSGWGMPDGVPRPNRDKIYATTGTAHGIPYGRMPGDYRNAPTDGKDGRDIQMQDAPPPQRSDYERATAG